MSQFTSRSAIPISITALPREEVPVSARNYWCDTATDLVSQILSKPRESRCLRFTDVPKAIAGYSRLARVIKRRPFDLPLTLRRDEECVYVMLDEIRARAKLEAAKVEQIRKGA